MQTLLNGSKKLYFLKILDRYLKYCIRIISRTKYQDPTGLDEQSQVGAAQVGALVGSDAVSSSSWDVPCEALRELKRSQML